MTVRVRPTATRGPRCSSSALARAHRGYSALGPLSAHLGLRPYTSRFPNAVILAAISNRWHEGPFGKGFLDHVQERADLRPDEPSGALQRPELNWRAGLDAPKSEPTHRDIIGDEQLGEHRGPGASEHGIT